MPDTTPAWWSELYSPRHGDTLAARTPAGGGRLPPAGEVIDLDAAPEPAPEPAAPAVESVPDDEPHPVVPEPRTRTRPKRGRPDYARIAELERDLGMTADEPAVEDDEGAGWAPVPPVHSIPTVDQYVNDRVARVQQRVAATPGRVRWLIYNGSAAGCGYSMHLVPWLHAALVECQAASGNDQVSAVILGAGTCAVIWWRWDSPTRHWRAPLPWITRIPLASAVLALALYAPGTH